MKDRSPAPARVAGEAHRAAAHPTQDSHPVAPWAAGAAGAVGQDAGPRVERRPGDSRPVAGLARRQRTPAIASARAVRLPFPPRRPRAARTRARRARAPVAGISGNVRRTRTAPRAEQHAARRGRLASVARPPCRTAPSWGRPWRKRRHGRFEPWFSSGSSRETWPRAPHGSADKCRRRSTARRAHRRAPPPELIDASSALPATPSERGRQRGAESWERASFPHANRRRNLERAARRGSITGRLRHLL